MKIRLKNMVMLKVLIVMMRDNQKQEGNINLQVMPRMNIQKWKKIKDFNSLMTQNMIPTQKLILTVTMWEKLIIAMKRSLEFKATNMTAVEI